MKTRLDFLKEAQRLERLWDNVGGADDCPKRKALQKQITVQRREYNRLTKIFIKNG